MIDKRVLQDTKIYSEMGEDDTIYWFDFRQQKFLHNIDTFYYSVMLSNDFTSSSQDFAVKKFRRYFERKYKELDEQESFDASLGIWFPGFESNLYLLPLSFAKRYNICLECPEMFDIFIAPVVPKGVDGKSVTTQVVVQLRSYPLWIYGTHRCFEMSFKYLQVLFDYFGLNVEFTQENRADYCWHSNYLSNPEQFFNPDKFYKMRVDRFKDAQYHTAKVGSDDYEIDYIAMGKRSDKIFIRIYLKSKEVVEKGYKPWFLKVWFFNGLINRYDLYVYEKAFLKHSWSYVNMARLEWYYEHGLDPGARLRCNDVLEGRKTLTAQKLKELADELTPKVNLIINVEYQVMRKHSKSYQLIPFKDNGNKGVHKRIYDYLDNHALIIDYLTCDVFRLCVLDSSQDTNKSRREMCSFWKSLRRTRLVDCVVKPKDVKLVREYNKKLNSEIVKQRVIKSAVTLGIYYRGVNDDSPWRDCVEALCALNDNDLHDAKRYKNKKLRQFNEKELAKLDKDNIPARPYQLIDTDTGLLLCDSDYMTDIV